MEKNTWFFNYGEMVGKSHLPKQIPCQDKALCACENGVSVAVVSDGCGSSDISQYGSDTTTKALCKLFTEKFDEVYDAEILDTRKIIVDAIVDGLKQFISENIEIFEEYKVTHADKYAEFTQKHTEEAFYLDCLNATALFVAEKDGKYMIGQIGDGVIGAVIGNKLKIIMEEKKEEEVNGTFYPTSLYAFAQKDPRWYGSSRFQLKKPRNAVVQAFILSTDGVDSFFDLRTPFQKKYTSGVDKLFRGTVEAESFEQGQKILTEGFLPALVEGSRSRDDCGVAVMVRGDYAIDEYVVTQYERPKMEETPVVPKTPAPKIEVKAEPPKEAEKPQSKDETTIVETPEPKENKRILPGMPEDMPEEEFLKEYEWLKEQIMIMLPRTGEKCLAKIERVAMSRRKIIGTLRLYWTILTDIGKQQFSRQEETVENSKFISILIMTDGNLKVFQDGEKWVRFERV